MAGKHLIDETMQFESADGRFVKRRRIESRPQKQRKRIKKYASSARKDNLNRPPYIGDQFDSTPLRPRHRKRKADIKPSKEQYQQVPAQEDDVDVSSEKWNLYNSVPSNLQSQHSEVENALPNGKAMLISKEVDRPDGQSTPKTPKLYPGNPELAKTCWFYARSEPPTDPDSPAHDDWPWTEREPECFWQAVEARWNESTELDRLVQPLRVEMYGESVAEEYRRGLTPVRAREDYKEREGVD